MELGLKGKIAVITASSKGLGRAVSEALAKEGVNLSICSRKKENITPVADEIRRKYGVKVIESVCDLTEDKGIEHLYDRTLHTFDSIDILFINNGGPPPGGIMDFEPKHFERALNLNLISGIKLVHKFLPLMLQKNWGRIVISTSISVKQPIPSIALSNVSRVGLVAYAKTLSREIAKYGITVNVVAPGYILTERVENLINDRIKKEGKTREEIINSLTKEIPVGRIGKPEEFGALVAFLASEKAGYINGTTILIDGGQYKGLF